MSMRGGIVVVLGVAAGVAYALARRVSQETGRDLVECLADVPSEAKKYWDDVISRAKEAVAAGREAASLKEKEIDDIIHGRTGEAENVGGQ